MTCRQGLKINFWFVDICVSTEPTSSFWVTRWLLPKTTAELGPRPSENRYLEFPLTIPSNLLNWHHLQCFQYATSFAWTLHCVLYEDYHHGNLKSQTWTLEAGISGDAFQSPLRLTIGVSGQTLMIFRGIYPDKIVALRSLRSMVRSCHLIVRSFHSLA